MLQEEVFFDCPYCGDNISVVVDLSVSEQSYIEDCEVCCRSLLIVCRVENGFLESFRAEPI